ncbi:MAG: Ig-like domain-containing protein, partial [Acidobacteriota bacterium]
VPGGSTFAVSGILWTADVHGDKASGLTITDGANNSSAFMEDMATQLEILRGPSVWPLGDAARGNLPEPPGFVRDACWQGDRSSWDSCSVGYCECFRTITDAVATGGGSCAFSAVSKLSAVPTSTSRGIIVAIQTAATLAACYEVAGDMSLARAALRQCRNTANQCFCDNFNIYDHYCEDAAENDIPIRLRITGLRPAEYVDVVGRCKDGGNIQTGPTVRFTEEDGLREVISCDPSKTHELLIGTVFSPGAQPGEQRQCHTPNPNNATTDPNGHDYTVDCACTNDPEDECAAFFIQGRVIGLDGLDTEDKEVRIRARITTPGLGSDPSSTYFLTATTRGDTDTMPFINGVAGGESVVYRGSEVVFTAEKMPESCHITPTETRLFGDPGEVVDAVEVRCSACKNTNSNCGSVSALAQVTGDRRPVTVSLILDGQPITRELTAASQSLGSVPAGASFEAVRVVDIIEEIEPPDGRYTICHLTSPVEGNVPDTAPAVVVTVDCKKMRNSETTRPVAPPGGGRDIFTWLDPYCTLLCPEGGSSGDSVTTTVPCPPCTCQDEEGNCTEPCLCEETTVVADRCILDCGPGPALVFGSTVSALVGGSVAGPDCAHVDDTLVVQGHASNPDGLQGFVMAIDGVYADHWSAGGSSSAALPKREIDTSNLADGTYEVSIIALSNHPDHPIPTEVKVPIVVDHSQLACHEDPTPAQVSFASPSATTLAPGPHTVRVNASDPESGIAHVQIHLNGRLLETLTSAPYELTWNATSGSHRLTAVATDRCGRSSIAEITVTVQDPCSGFGPPVVTITNLTDGQPIPPGSLMAQAAVSDPSGSGITEVRFIVDGKPTIDIQAPWQSTPQYVEGTGTLPISVRAVDGCGRAGSEQITVQLTQAGSLCVSDQTPPTVSLITPGTIIGSGNRNVVVNASDASGLAWAKLHVDGVFQGTVVSDDTADFRWPWIAEPGDRTLMVQVADVCNRVAVLHHTVDVINSLPWGPGQGNVVIEAGDGRILDGIHHPPGPLVMPHRVISLGETATGVASMPVTATMINDGYGPLTVNGVTTSGPFTATPTTTLPVVLEIGEAVAFDVTFDGTGHGPVLGQLDVGTSTGPRTARLCAESGRPGGCDATWRLVESFEHGGYDEWDVYGSTATVTAAAALRGEYGLEVDTTGTYQPAFLHQVLGTSGSDAIRVGISVDASALSLPAGTLDTFFGIDAYTDGVARAQIQIRESAGTHQVRLRMATDAAGYVESTWIDLASSGPTRVEAAFWTGSGDGGGWLRANGSTTTLDHLSTANQTYRRVRFGSVWGTGSVDAIEGSLSIDDIEVWF